MILALCGLTSSSALAADIYGFGGQFVNGSVFAATYFNEDLIAGGNFGSAGAAPLSMNLARWNGTAWVGMNMPGAQGPGVGNGLVHALAVHQGELFVAGSMRTQDGALSEHIMRWDGTNWSGVGSGVGEDLPGDDGRASALLSVGNNLYVGGDFITAGGMTVNRVAKWDGSSWSGLGSGLDSSVVALVEYAGEIVAGGYFSLGGGVAVWDGSNWHALALGQGLGSVHDLVVFNGRLVAAGDFDLGGGSNLAWLDGNKWKPLGGGTDGWTESLAVAGGRLYVGGAFNSVGSGAAALPASRIAAWDGTAWIALTSGVEGQGPGEIFDLFSDGTEVIVGGSFYLAGGLDAPNLAVWTGSSWSNELSNCGNGLNASSSSFLTSDDGSLIVGGAFTRAGGQVANRIARWDGTWQTYGDGFNGSVIALAEFNGSIIAAGSFTLSGTQSVNRIALWNGTVWIPLGSGLDGTVRALTIYNGQLTAGGDFTSAGGQTCNRIAQWDGTAWYPLGSGFDNTVMALTVYDGALIAGGSFSLNGGLARWTNGSWAPVGSPLQGLPSSSVNSLTQQGSYLVIAGRFDHIGPVNVLNVARWDGTTWFSMPSPLNGPGHITNYFGTLVGSGSVYFGSGVVTLNSSFAWNLLVAATGNGPMLAHDGGSVKALVVGGSFIQMAGVPSCRIALVNPEWSSTAIVEDDAHSRFRAFPNPFQHSVTITFTLETPAHVEMKVLDVQGRIMSKVIDKMLPAGVHETSWGARDMRGQRVTPGVYFVRVRRGDLVESRQVVLME